MPRSSGAIPATSTSIVHTGDSGQGLTHGVAGSLLLSRLIAGEKCPWAEFYDPARVTLSAAKNFIVENVTAVKNFAEYVAPGELKSVDELKPGHGAIIREGLRKVAAFRDDDGRIHRVSAACTHVGCHLHWNSLERCWDCPCHGSHFAIDGTPSMVRRWRRWKRLTRHFDWLAYRSGMRSPAQFRSSHRQAAQRGKKKKPGPNIHEEKGCQRIQPLFVSHRISVACPPAH